jgi:hypothetical protein
MKKIFFTLMIMMPYLAISQPPNPPRPGQTAERMQSIQVAYLTRELNLSPQDAEKFWPVYNRYQDEMKTVLMNRSEGDALDKQQKVLDIRKKYKTDFTKVLGADRTNRLFEAEIRFREMVKREFQNRQRRRN